MIEHTNKKLGLQQSLFSNKLSNKLYTLQVELSVFKLRTNTREGILRIGKVHT